MVFLVPLFWFIPALVAALGGAFKWVIATSIGMFLVRCVAVLGIGMVTYVGANYSINFFLDYVKSEMLVLGPMASIFGIMGVDVGISLILSAYSVGLTLKTVGGVIRKIALVGT